MFRFDRFDCLRTEGEYKEAGQSLIENQDGTVSLFLSDGTNNTTQINNKSCCEILGYKFDIENQKCLWKDLEETQEKEPFKIVLNPEGNDGTLFGVDENETCCLDISFDYMFKFDCGDLIESTTTTTTVINENGETISKLEGALQENNELIAYYQNLINQLNEIPYVIECGENNELDEAISSGVSVYDNKYENKTNSAYSNKTNTNRD